MKNGKDLCEEYGVETIKRIRFAKNIGEKSPKHPSLLEEIETQMKQVVNICINTRNESAFHKIKHFGRKIWVSVRHKWSFVLSIVMLLI